jgi:hypothetical protein
MKPGVARSGDEKPLGLNLAEYAEAKRLPLQFLKNLGLGDVFIGGTPTLRIPYKDKSGEEAAVRFRHSMDGKAQRFSWRKGSKPCLYGLERIESAREAGRVSLVEGESDSQTLWYHGEPALGLPGAANWKPEWVSQFEGIETIHVVIEPDKGGAAVLNWVANSPIRHRVRLVRLKGAKDPSELHLEDPKGFRKAWKQALADSQPWSEYERLTAEAKAKEFWVHCKNLAKKENILDCLADALVQKGLAGERRKALLLYLAVTSRLLDRPVSVGVKGVSSAGKSHLVERVLEFVPANSFYMLTAMSDKVLAYSEEPLSHRFLVLCEAAALGSDWVSYFVRSLLSEGRLIYETVEKTKDGLRARRIEREGPTGLITTTTAVALHHENETRYISFQLNDTPKQTSRILRIEAARVAGGISDQDPARPEDFLKPWLGLQEWLRHTVCPVVVPFAPELAELIPPVAVRLRRDFNAVLTLVQAHALLHKATRKRDSQGQVIATLDDYAAVRELVHTFIAEGVEQNVGKTIRETVDAVTQICSDDGSDHQGAIPPTATVAKIAEVLEVDRSTAHRRVQEALKRGFLEAWEHKKRGRALRVLLGDELPEDRTLLPSATRIAKNLKRNAAD